MTSYRERLWPTPWMFVATALVIPASLLVFLPINGVVGVVVAIVLYLGCVGILLLSAPTIRVEDGLLVAGKARLPLNLIGSLDGSHGEAAQLERGQRLDARAYLLIRGWIDPVLKVEVVDQDDPAPYWLVSTRDPKALAEALTAAKQNLTRN